MSWFERVFGHFELRKKWVKKGWKSWQHRRGVDDEKHFTLHPAGRHSSVKMQEGERAGKGVSMMTKCGARGHMS